jgi:hypothetical protein
MGRVADRITPYKEGGSVEDRIDEIVMHGADIHFEMMDNSGAYVGITDKKGTYHRFWFGAVKSKLVLALRETITKKELKTFGK